MKTHIFGINLKRRTIKYLSASGRIDRASFGVPTSPDGKAIAPAVMTVIIRVCLSILVLLWIPYLLVSCVETAECDETVACVDGKVCYDLKCQSACTEESDCKDTESCEPCLENFGAGVSDHCFADSRLACVATEGENE